MNAPSPWNHVLLCFRRHTPYEMTQRMGLLFNSNQPVICVYTLATHVTLYLENLIILMGRIQDTYLFVLLSRVVTAWLPQRQMRKA